MNLIKKITLVSILALSSVAANAELISTDWKIQGDGLATLDSVSGIEWLDLTQTRNLTVAQVIYKLDHEYLGWRLPSFEEYSTLLSNVFSGVNLGSPTVSVTAAKAAYWSDHFGFASGANSRGWIKNGVNNLKLAGLSSTTLYSNHQYNYYDNYYSASTAPSVTVFLVNDGGVTLSSINDPSLNAENPNAPVNEVTTSVPLPATLGLLGLALAGLSFRRKNTFNNC